ncbi:MAG TPA: hypothetical protein VFH73_22045 [Polyangia bacterium]|jgi:hypothetical protein|nr:hypothetical protein [Polyangia bacterium]
MSLLLALWVATTAAAAPPRTPVDPPATVIPFRTDAQPRVDPVFGDITTLRASVDRFLTLQTEMDRVREEFSTAVHETLAALRPAGESPVSRQCPAATAAPYARALSSGAHYLALGQQLQGRYREIRRSDDLGDSVGLTPDYRWKVKRAKDLYFQLLTDYREMRVAFYDQLGAELRHAHCRLTSRSPAAVARAGESPPEAPNPSDPGAWALEDTLVEADAPAVRPSAPAKSSMSTDAAKAPPGGESPSAGAQAIWIDIDNSLCTLATRVSIDGQSLGEISGRKKTSLRTRAGPHEVCVLPTSDARSCGDPGTLRRAYLHEGWALTVFCNR